MWIYVLDTVIDTNDCLSIAFWWPVWLWNESTWSDCRWCLPVNSLWCLSAEWCITVEWSHHSNVTCLICVLHCLSTSCGWLSRAILAQPPSSSSSTGCPLTEGLHPPSDPWGSAGSMVQPGFSSMLGNTPHLNQHGPFSAINPQDRLVSSAPTLFLWRHNGNMKPKQNVFALYLYICEALGNFVLKSALWS